MFKMKNRRIYIIGLISSAVMLSLVLALLLPMFSLRIDAKGNYLSLSFDSVSAYAPNWYEDSQLSNGLWYSDINNPIIVGGQEVSFMKIYSIGGTLRVMELSTYPRAYKDTSAHVYTVDTPFVVTQDDLNDFYYSQAALDGMYEVREGVADGTFVYICMEQGRVWLLGENAIHFVGEPLPGVFPLWVASETLPLPSWVDRKNDVFPFVFGAVKGELVTTALHEGVYRSQDSATWTVIPSSLFTTYSTLFTDATSDIRVTKLVKNKDRIILRIIYDKIIQ